MRDLVDKIKNNKTLSATEKKLLQRFVEYRGKPSNLQHCDDVNHSTISHHLLSMRRKYECQQLHTLVIKAFLRGDVGFNKVRKTIKKPKLTKVQSLILHAYMSNDLGLQKLSAILNKKQNSVTSALEAIRKKVNAETNIDLITICYQLKIINFEHLKNKEGYNDK